MTRVFVKNDEPLYKYAIHFMESMWGTKRGIFPGSQPVSVEYKHFPILRENDYVVCEKTDGLRYMLLAFTFGPKRVCVLVNRALEMFVCPLNFRKQIYDGTILEGELYNEFFMIYDCLRTCGQDIRELNFLNRLEHIEKTVKKMIVLKSDPVILKIKTFHLLDDYEEFLDKYLPTVSQKIDGLVFTPINEPVKSGTHETMFKWKPKEKNTVDFLMKMGRDFTGIGKRNPLVWRLYVQERGKLIFESSIPRNRIPDEPWFEDNAIVECMYMPDDTPMWWKPIKRRTDKTYPNSRRTFYRTIVNIKEDIDIREFLDCRPIRNTPPSSETPQV